MLDEMSNVDRRGHELIALTMCTMPDASKSQCRTFNCARLLLDVVVIIHSEIILAPSTFIWVLEANDMFVRDFEDNDLASRRCVVRENREPSVGF